MSNINARIGESLLNSLTALRKDNENPSIEDIGVMFQEMVLSMNLSSGSADSPVFNEIQKLASIIEKAKAEMASMNTDNSGDATQQLEAVIKSTEEATITIMDCTDAIQAAAAGTAKEQEITDAVMKIFEACNFQDLTGQRLNKVIKLLSEIDGRVHAILTLFGVKDIKGLKVVAGNDLPAKPQSDEDLLNGPQLEKPKQDDIDALFASLNKK